MWILTTVYSTSEWGDGPAGFFIEIDRKFVDAMRGINEAVQDASSRFGARISHVDLPLDACSYYVLEYQKHEGDVCDLLGLDRLPEDMTDGVYAIFDENPFVCNPAELDSGADDTFSVRLDDGVFCFVSLSGDPELSTPWIALNELGAYV